jgi:hypothetical protein
LLLHATYPTLTHCGRRGCRALRQGQGCRCRGLKDVSRSPIFLGIFIWHCATTIVALLCYTVGCSWTRSCLVHSEQCRWPASSDLVQDSKQKIKRPTPRLSATFQQTAGLPPQDFLLSSPGSVFFPVPLPSLILQTRSIRPTTVQVEDSVQLHLNFVDGCFDFD